MRTSESRPARGRRLLAATLGAAVLALAGCHNPAAPPPDPSTPGAPPRPFTVMSTDEVTVTDPAAVTDQASSMFTLNVFQRLMTSAPGDDVLKPDAARDCIFTATTTYTCTLQKDLTFAGGDPLTSSDVKFSIERALRLDVAGSSTSLLSTLRRIETPDDLTVRFVLSREDTQFGWALASPAASIVDEQVYDADKVRSPKDPAVGSGPFVVTADDESGSSKSIVFNRFPAYKGFSPAQMDTLTYKTVADSATIEDAMEKGEVDVVSRGLNSAAVTRLSQQVGGSPDRVTASGFSQKTLAGARVEQLVWSPSSPARANKGLRTAITLALQGDRTLDSVVPNGVVGHVASFPQGGKTRPKVTWKNRINLTLAYDETAPNSGDLADQVRNGSRTPAASACGWPRARPTPTSSWSTARPGPRPRCRGCSRTWTTRCRRRRRPSTPPRRPSAPAPTTRARCGCCRRSSARRSATRCCCPSPSPTRPSGCGPARTSPTARTAPAGSSACSG